MTIYIYIYIDIYTINSQDIYTGHIQRQEDL